jgi:predicted NBD/HSP70 family sugar kinase
MVKYYSNYVKYLVGILDESRNKYMKKNGKNLEAMQAMNRKLILKLLLQNNICSRAELSKQTGLKQATITNIINDFISWELVTETGMIEGHKGRRSIGIKLSDKKFFVIGVRLTRKYFIVGIFTLLGEEIGEGYKELILDTTPKVVINKICNEINKIIKNDTSSKFLAVGVAVPGPYNQTKGVIESISGFDGWIEIPIRDRIQQQVNIPVVVDHDANAGVVAECSLAINPSLYGTVVYIAIGQGIGSGIISNGKLFQGFSGIAGEIGHTCIDLNGLKCECGNKGCLTLYASTMAFVDRIKEKNKLDRRFTDEEIVFENLIDKVKEKDEYVYEEFKNIMKYLSVGIINVIYSYNPGLIILGDEMSKIGDEIINELKNDISELTTQGIVEQVKIQLTSFKKDPAYIGAAALAIDYAFGYAELFFK